MFHINDVGFEEAKQTLRTLSSPRTESRIKLLISDLEDLEDKIFDLIENHTDYLIADQTISLNDVSNFIAIVRRHQKKKSSPIKDALGDVDKVGEAFKEQQQSSQRQN